MLTWASWARFSLMGIVIACLLSVPAFSAFAQPAQNARVTGTGPDGLILRAEASRTASMIAVEPEGAVVVIIGPEQATDRSWLPVRDAQGRVGWLAAEYLTRETVAVATPTATPVRNVALESPELALPTATPTPRRTPPLEAEAEPGLPLTVEVRFKMPELDRRDRQEILVEVTRNSQPVQDVLVRFIVEDEDPEVEREATLTNVNGRSHHEWSMRKYRGTTTVRVTALAPDGGTGKATSSFFVK